MDTIWFLIVGVVAGWLAGQVVKGGGLGLIGDLVVGVVGALIGGFLFGGRLPFLPSGIVGSIITATLGAIVLLVLLRLIRTK